MSRRRHDEALVFKKVDGHASPSELEALAERLGADPAVARALEIEEGLVEGLGRLPLEAPPRDLVAAAERRSRAPSRPPVRAWRWAAATVAAGVIFAVSASLWRLGGDAPVRSVTVSRSFHATAVVGTVWVHTSGERHRGIAGERIVPGTRIESEAASILTMAHADRASVTVLEGTAVEIELDGAARFAWEVERGVIRAESRDPRLEVVVRIIGRPHTIALRDASAGVLADGRGGFAVATIRGGVEVRGGGEPLQLIAGRELAATAVGSPAVRDAGGPALVLDLAPVLPLDRAVRTVEIEGRTRPGILLTIDGVPVAVGDDGAFRHQVAFDGRPRRLVVRVRDALDRRREQVLALAPAPQRKAPRDPRFRRIETEWEWEKSPPERG